MNSNSAAITCQNVSKRFGKVQAVTDLSLEIFPGEVVGVIGANGAGKSTTMRMLVDLIRPTSGTINILGQPPCPDIRRHIGYLPGDVHVPTKIKVGALLNYYARLNGTSLHQAEQEISKLASVFTLDLHREAHTLSKGNRQKIGLIQAFLHTPKVLILDEPTSGLDPLMQQKFLDQVTTQADRGTAVFLSSHVLSEIQACADRIIVLQQGKIIAQTTMAELFAAARLEVKAVLVPANHHHSVQPPAQHPSWQLACVQSPTQLAFSGSITSGTEGQFVAFLQQQGEILQLQLVPEDLEHLVFPSYEVTK